MAVVYFGPSPNDNLKWYYLSKDDSNSIKGCATVLYCCLIGSVVILVQTVDVLCLCQDRAVKGMGTGRSSPAKNTVLHICIADLQCSKTHDGNDHQC
jgi:hypothetical protein